MMDREHSSQPSYESLMAQLERQTQEIAALRRMVTQQRLAAARLAQSNVRLEQEKAALNKQLGIDFLTGLRDRRGFEQAFEPLFMKARSRWGDEDPRAVVLALMDLDGLKKVNDTFGHPAGDFVLVQFARRLENLVRPTDIVARLGGDEFALALDDVLRNDATSIAIRMQEGARFHTEVPDLGQSVFISAGMGWTIVSASDETPRDPLARADRHLIEDKPQKYLRRNGA